MQKKIKNSIKGRIEYRTNFKREKSNQRSQSYFLNYTFFGHEVSPANNETPNIHLQNFT